MLEYQNELHHNNVVFSIDKLRIHFSIRNNATAELEFKKFFRWASFMKNCDTYTSYRVFNYRDIINFPSGLTVGLMNNSANVKDKFAGFIEFNPNKQLNDFYEVKTLLNKFCYNYHLKTFDIACDFNLPRGNMFFLKDKRNYRFFEKHISAIDTYAVTEYLGKRGTNGFCKLYNKSAESCLSYDLTRFEITLTKLDYANLINNMPTVCYFDNNFLNAEINGLTLELVRMCYIYGDFSALSMLSRNTRYKLRDNLVLHSFDFPIHIFAQLKMQIENYIKL